MDHIPRDFDQFDPLYAVMFLSLKSHSDCPLYELIHHQTLTNHIRCHSSSTNAVQIQDNNGGILMPSKRDDFWVCSELERFENGCDSVTERGLESFGGGSLLIMSDLVARTGRHQQRYEDGHRLVAGCIPFRYRSSNESNDEEKIIEVLMINSASGPGLLFPKGGWENDETVEEAAKREAIEEAGVRGNLMDFLGYYYFKSKTHQDEFSPEGLCKAAMFALFVTQELSSWPEQNTRNRKWLTLPEAAENCRHSWIKEALVGGFFKFCSDKLAS